MERVQVAAGVYAVLADGNRLGDANSGLLGAGGGLVVDSMYDLPHARELLRLYGEVLPEPPRRVLNTHHNGDHCWGNQLFAEAGAELLGSRECAARMTTEANPELFVALCEADPATLPPGIDYLAEGLRRFDFAGVTITPPTTLLDGDTTLDLDGVEVQLLSVGPAHTAGDTVVWLPAEGVLFTGDILFHECTPIGWEGTFAGWTGALERLAALDPAVVVPGHGPLATTADLLELRDYLDHVRAEAAVHHAHGLSPLEAARRIELGRYAAWQEPERLAFQVDRAYRELDGMPWDTPVDAATVFAMAATLRKEWAGAS